MFTPCQNIMLYLYESQDSFRLAYFNLCRMHRQFQEYRLRKDQTCR